MDRRERLIWDLIVNDRASTGFRNTGRAAQAADDDVMGLARRLDEVGAKSAEARVSLKGDKDALAALDRLDLKMAAIGARVMSPDIKIDGAARAAVELSTLDRQIDLLGSKSEKAAGAGGKTGLSALTGAAGGAPTGMAALITAGAALSPVLVTLGFGLGGLAAAAYGVAKPILNAAQKTGGLQANLKLLNPEQRLAAQSIHALGQQYGVFQQQLQPEVLGVFNQGLKLASHLMGDVEPVAKATGNALEGVLGSIDKEFKSGTWQQFFGFMEQNAAPDMRLLGNLFVNLLDALPPLVKDLQPLAVILLQDATNAVKLANGAAQLIGQLDKIRAWQIAQEHHPTNPLGWLEKAGNWVYDKTFGPIVGDLKKIGASSTVAATGLSKSSQAAVVWSKSGPPLVDTTRELSFNVIAAAAATQRQAVATRLAARDGRLYTGVIGTATPKVFSLAAAVTALTNAMQANVTAVLTLQGDDIAWRQALQAAEQQLKSNTAGLRGNSANALANKQAVLAATNAAVSFADDQLKLHGNLRLASSEIQAQIGWLQKHGEKSQFAAEEIRALRDEEAKIKAQIKSQISVSGTGQWNIVQSNLAGPTPGKSYKAGFAAGGLIGGGTPGRDSVPVLAMPGEAFLSVAHTRMLAPLLAAAGVPGFASGGVVGSFAGSVPGLAKWVGSEMTATLTAISSSVASSVKSALSQALSFGAGGPAGGDAAANAALARAMFPQWATGANWLAWNYVAMRESGWNRLARNPSSGAYGIPQALPESKLPFAGQSAGGSHAGPQIAWMAAYMDSVYGGPQGAAAHERALNWYGGGLRDGYFDKPTIIGVGDRPERVNIEPAGRRHRDGPLVTFGDVYPTEWADATVIAQQVSAAIVASGFG